MSQILKILTLMKENHQDILMQLKIWKIFFLNYPVSKSSKSKGKGKAIETEVETEEDNDDNDDKSESDKDNDTEEGQPIIKKRKKWVTIREFVVYHLQIRNSIKTTSTLHLS